MNIGDTNKTSISEETREKIMKKGIIKKSQVDCQVKIFDPTLKKWAQDVNNKDPRSMNKQK